MRIILSVILSMLIMLSVTLSVIAQGVVIKGEPDGQNKSVIMDERFYSGSLEPNFTSDTVSVKTDSYAMHFEGAYQYGSALVLAAYKLRDYNRFTFSIEMLEYNGGFIYCGFGGPNTTSSVSNYDFNLCFTKSITALYKKGKVNEWDIAGDGLPLTDALVAGKTTDFAITLQKATGKDYKVTFEMLENGEAIASTDYGVLVHMDNPNGHFCMWGSLNEQFNLKNFKAYDSKTHLAFSDDFEKDSLTYGDELVGNSNWHINVSNLTREDVYICRNAGPELKKSGDCITAKNKLVPNDKVSKPYEISVDAQIKSLSKNATFGLFFGAEKPNDIDNATIVGVSANNDKFASVNLISNGKTIDIGEKRIPVKALSVGESKIKLSAVFNYDNSLVFNIGGVQFTFNDVKYGGYFGICNYSSDKKSASDVRINRVTVIKNSYESCFERDLSNDFGGTKKTKDGFDEYYISDRTYYIGPNVSLRPKGAFTTEPSLYFESSGPYSAFAPKQKYSDFILQFDVKMVSSGTNGQYFGVAFGRDSYADVATTSTSVNFGYNGWSDTPYTHISTNLCSFDDGAKERKIEEYHFYKDKETKYNFMVVAKNRNVYVYYKKDSEDISKLGICRAVIPDVNTYGYVSIFGMGSISFDVFNYKLTNIAPEAKKDSNIALRESFDGKSLSEKLVTEGSAEVSDGAIKLSGGSLSTKNKSRYYIANFTVLKSGADLSVSFANNKSFTVSKDLKSITVKDGSSKSSVDISKYNLSDYKSLQFQMILQYDSIAISAKGIYEPSDKLSSPIAEYTFDSPVAEGVLKWTSEDALIDDVSLFALDNTFKAETINFEQDPNDTEMWPTDGQSDKSENQEKGIPTLYIILYAAIGAVILVLLVVIVIITVKKKRGKAQ